MDIKLLILIFAAIWTIVGIIYYIFMFNKVKLPKQRFVLFIIGGPILWGGLPLFSTLDKLSEKIFEPIHRWLTKE